MFVRVWRFTIREADRERFEAAYGESGDWARLFAKADGFIGTELLRERNDGGPAYVTLDRWREEADWTRFLDKHGDDYRALDLECEALTVDEAEIGDFVSA
jgi:heme-degrading monooxygenase HmoA